MPTISIYRDDLETLLAGGERASGSWSLDELENWLALVKGELKGHNSETGELRIELQDSNRPDLWCCEGIARQIRIKRAGKPQTYPFFKKPQHTTRMIVVGPGLETVRPYIAGCAATGYSVSDEGLAQLIQTQEKLADIFGRKRRTVSVGLYRLADIVFPVRYELVKPDAARFTPLGMDTVMTPAEILLVHPKGIEYGCIVAGHDRVPLLRDSKGQVLSFPPIINSREIGEVQIGDSELFVEVTGTDLAMVVLTLNIFAANLADRGATITPVRITYPGKTSPGRSFMTPTVLGKSRSIPRQVIETALGERLSVQEIGNALTAYGYHVTKAAQKVAVRLPPYRNDVLHDVDVVEDVAISRGYNSFAPVMPSQFTVGGVSRLEDLAHKVRDLVVGMGFQEMIANIMGSRHDFCTRMRIDGSEWAHLVEVDNVMTQSYACLRQWVLPSLLRVEAASGRAFYPHRIFEVGEVTVPDIGVDVGSRTLTILGAVIAHSQANFSEIHSCLDLLLYYLGFEYKLAPLDHPSFLDGRAGRILCHGQRVGLLGEVHPEVLELWQTGVPVAALELDLTRISELLEANCKD
jgi:phenylalanyl-tRNA synthetase beta chain